MPNKTGMFVRYSLAFSHLFKADFETVELPPFQSVEHLTENGLFLRE